ncbi:hypothetical protein [Dyadobacter sp. MSC1_007]|jgi:hypothetical protein|uniref:hypothetical protein n=1 Tax=Dyadobacter sp. MSC1_007 TaxID=2909264 RepID=UPI002030C7A6|nr:hypothetical protein [Dyadobacter sp. MSC1_007]
MVRTLLVPDNSEVSIRLPESFVGKQVEVIAFTINDLVEHDIEHIQPLTHYASQKSLAKDWLTKEEDEAWQNL